MATMGVVFMKPLSTHTGLINRNCAVTSEVGRPRRTLAIRSIAPVSRMPAATTKRPPIISGPSLTNPSTASSVLNTPKTIRSTRDPITATSVPTLVKSRNPTRRQSTPRVIQISKVMSGVGPREV